MMPTTTAHPASLPPPDSPAPGVVGPAALALLAVVAAVWLGLQPAPGEGDAATEASPPAAATPADLPGFRADAWFLPDDAQLGFVEIPAGPFSMGAAPSTDPEAFDNERWSAASAQGTVHLPAYLIGRHEVTVAQFAAFVAATGFATDAQALDAPPDHPVANVSWPDALAYCRWLDAELRSSPQTPAALAERLQAGWQVTLPSEAQWEKAARGNDGRRYPWGGEMRRDRVFAQGGGTAPAGSVACPECPYGLLDMSGNVWEWTRSPLQPYPFDDADRGDLDADALWVMRGGSFTDPARNLRTTTRGGADPGARRPFIGFRVALSPPRP